LSGSGINITPFTTGHFPWLAIARSFLRLSFRANRLASTTAKSTGDLMGQRSIGAEHFDGFATRRGLVARSGLQERLIGVGLAGFAAGALVRRSGFQSGFLTMAVRLITVCAFFSVFGGFGNSIYGLRHCKTNAPIIWARAVNLSERK
jgi:hypothetical protein